MTLPPRPAAGWERPRVRQGDSHLRAADLFVYVWMAPDMARGRADLFSAVKERDVATSLMRGGPPAHGTETMFKGSTGVERARHGVHTVWGLDTWGAATVTAHTILGICLAMR